jgi:hypothetical protein
MLAPIQEENRLSCGEAVRILGLKAAGIRVSVSQYRRWESPDSKEPPPVRITGKGKKWRVLGWVCGERGGG